MEVAVLGLQQWYTMMLICTLYEARPPAVVHNDVDLYIV